MTRFLITTLFALSLFVGGMNAFVPAAEAVGNCPGTQIFDPIIETCVSPLAAPAAASSAAAGGAPAGVGTDAGDQTALPTSVTLGDNSGILVFIMGLFAWLLGIAAITLDAAVYYTVLTMGTYIKDLSAIGITWTILRDIGNIALIFGFLMAGINIILGTNFYGEGNKLIPTLIIVAVSLNFSLFVAEAVIDTGNMFATQIYSAINKGEQAGNLGSSTETRSEGIGGVIMAQMGLQTIYGEAMTNKAIFQPGTPTGVAFMAIILFLVTAFVLFSLAFILVARFVILILVIITSPIGFIGYAIPPMEAKAKLWWHTLFSQTITAPVLMLSLYVALSVITDENFFSGFTTDGSQAVDGTIATWAVLVTDPAGFGGMVLTFLVAMGLLLAVNMIAKDLSAFGASTAIKWAGRASFGAAAYALSAPTGLLARGARYGAQNYLNPTGRASRWISNTARFAENRTFDIRNAPLLGGAIGAGLSAGGSSEASEGVGASAAGRVGQGIHAVQHMVEETNRQHDQETLIPRLRRAVADHGAAPTQANRDALENILRTLPEADLESHNVVHMLAHGRGAAGFATLLPQNRFERLMQSANVESAEKTAIRQHRDNAVMNRIAPLTIPVGAPGARTNAELVQDFGQMTNADLESAQVINILTDGTPIAQRLATLLPQNQFDRLMGSNITAPQKLAIRTARQAGITQIYSNAPNPDPAAGGVTYAESVINGVAGQPNYPGLSSQQRAELPNAVLAQGHVIRQLRLPDYAAIARRGTLSGPAQGAMTAHIAAEIAAGTPLALQLRAYARAQPDFGAYFSI